jgi:hypothetical protein
MGGLSEAARENENWKVENRFHFALPVSVFYFSVSDPITQNPDY